jgi:hypothetical protein
MTILRSMQIHACDRAEHWRAQAIEARALAELLTDPEAKRLMLGVAVGRTIGRCSSFPRATASQRSASPSSSARASTVSAIEAMPRR